MEKGRKGKLAPLDMIVAVQPWIAVRLLSHEERQLSEDHVCFYSSVLCTRTQRDAWRMPPSSSFERQKAGSACTPGGKQLENTPPFAGRHFMSASCEIRIRKIRNKSRNEWSILCLHCCPVPVKSTQCSKQLSWSGWTGALLREHKDRDQCYKIYIYIFL